MLEVLAAGLILVSAAAAEPSTKQATEEVSDATGDDRIKCKRLAVTGSLTKKVKTCRTVAEWRRMREDNSEYARDLQDYTRTRSGGN